MREEKISDKINDSNSTLMVFFFFEQESVINLPEADVSFFFYKRKWNMCHLTEITSRA